MAEISLDVLNDILVRILFAQKFDHLSDNTILSANQQCSGSSVNFRSKLAGDDKENSG